MREVNEINTANQVWGKNQVESCSALTRSYLFSEQGYLLRRDDRKG